MAQSARKERQHLEAGEADLVERTRMPALIEMADDALHGLIEQVQSAYDRLRTAVAEQRQAARSGAARAGKAAGAAVGLRKQVLAKAMVRLKRELGRRGGGTAKEQARIARRALKGKRSRARSGTAAG